MRRLARRNQAAVFVLFLAAIVFALNASSAFAATPPANTVAPSLSGTAKDGMALTAAKGTWTAWDRSSTRISGKRRLTEAAAGRTSPGRPQPRSRHPPALPGPKYASSSPAPTATARRKPPHPRAQSSSPTRPSTPSRQASRGPPRTASPSPQQRHLDRRRHDHLRLPVADLHGRRHHLDRHRRRNRHQLHATRRLSRQTTTRPRHRHQRRRHSQAASPASAVIVANPPVNTVAPSLSGTAKDGVALTSGTWTGIATITYTYQWQISADGGTTWTDIPGATAPRTRHPPAQRQPSTRPRHRHQRRRHQPSSFTRKRRHPRQPAPQHRRTQPLGTAKDGLAQPQLRHLDRRRDHHLHLPVADLRRRRHHLDRHPWATAPPTRHPPAQPANKSRARHRNQPRRHQPGRLTRERRHPRDPPVNTVAPSLSGAAKDGQPLRLNRHLDRLATITYTYQWQISTDGGITWTDIPGATATTYTPPAGTAGKQARVLVTATNPDGTSQSASSASAVILASPPLNTVAPTLTGTAKDGQSP